MATKIILFISLITYSVIVSQSFMYMLALKNTQLALNGSSYTEVRQLIDANMRNVLTWFIYAALLSNLLLLIVSFKSSSWLFVLAVGIALLALIADIILTLKGNLPINDIINSWSPQHFPENWQDIRQQWFQIYQYRQVITITGFLGLLAGAIFTTR